MARRTPTTNRPAGGRRPGRLLRRRRGFTLIEAMIAAVLVAVCVSAVAGALSAAYANRAAAARQAEALALARDLLEQVARRPMGFAQTAAAGVDPAGRAVLARGKGGKEDKQEDDKDPKLVGTVKGVVSGLLGGKSPAPGADATVSDVATEGGDALLAMAAKAGLEPVSLAEAALEMPETVMEFDGYADAIRPDEGGGAGGGEAAAMFVRAATVEPFGPDADRAMRDGGSPPVALVTVVAVTPDGQTVVLTRVVADSTPAFH